ncbi:pentapeptide repeat-containing protein [Lusitaniella coriacea]|uniref:pentapeptide repeat-containing protein n=1 Tax=Lusitaniella coriacea TaxID=1983105 RepID=UPI003CEB6F2A
MSLSIRQWLAERQIDLNSLLTPGAEVSGVAFRIIQDMEVKSLSPFDICSIADVLELPLRASVRVAQPIAQLTIGLLRLLSRKKTLKRSEGAWLAFQVAYLNALQAILEQEAHLRRPWIDRAKVPVGEDSEQPFSDPKLQGLLQTLRPGRLSDSQAEQALSVLGESFLVQQIDKVAIAWLVANGAEETEAKLLIARLVNGLPGYLLATIAENAIPLAQLQKFVRLGKLSSLGSTLTTESDVDEDDSDIAIDLAREQYRAQLIAALSEPLLGATFSLKEIYVPLKGIPIEDRVPGQVTAIEHSAPPPSTDKKAVDLKTWVLEQLEKQDSIIAIEAEPGLGKSSFCQIFAAQIAKERYPEWMPVSIRLQEVKLGQTFEQTLESAFPQGRFTDTEGWLSSHASPLLLILDGLDELPPSPQKLRHHFVFIDQLMQFHAQCLSHHPPLRHKIVLTARPSTFEHLTRRYRVGSFFPLQPQIERILIQPMDRAALQQWFTQWSQLQSKSISFRYFSFLKEEGLFAKRSRDPDITRLVHQPLMLYLLGILHRDGLLDKSLFNKSLPQVKFEIYERISRWLVGATQGRQLLPEGIREGMAHANRGSEAIANLLAGRPPQQTLDLMEETALKLFQTGLWSLDCAMGIADAPLPALFFSRPPQALLQCELSSTPVPQKDRLTFSHFSLGSYLGAVAIAKQLKALTEQLRDRYGDRAFIIDSPQAVASHLYRVLGYGLISGEMEELLMEYLQRQEKRNPKAFSFALLFDRLYRFYRAYCQGRWMDEGIAREVHQQLQSLQNPLNVLQVDAAVGLNVFLLLCAIARTASVPFWPCGDPNHPEEFDPDRLMTFIARISVLSPTCFFTRARHSLSQLQLLGACLNRAMLPETNLQQANLSVAELNRANLVAANLSQANLSWASLAGANLQNSDLSQANLEGADLSGANLLGANLAQANLANACMDRAQLDEENLELARKRGAFFSWEEFHSASQTLATSLHRGNLPDAEFFDTDSKIQIEVAEGEPILPNVWDESLSNLTSDLESPSPEPETPSLHETDKTVALPNPTEETVALPEEGWQPHSPQVPQEQLDPFDMSTLDRTDH